MEDYEPVCTADEARKIDELRASVLERLGRDQAEPIAAPLFTRESLLRFARARPNIAASAKMLIESIKWRKEFDLDAKLRAWESDHSPEAERLRAAWLCKVHGTDNRGCPVYYAAYGKMDMAALVKDAGMDRLIAISLADQREIEQGLLRAARASGRHPVQVVCVADFDGMQWGRASRAVKPFLAMQKLLDHHFPERLHVGVVCRAPRIFSAIYKMASPFLAADTKEKVRLCGRSDDHTKVLRSLIPDENIPQLLGGSSTCKLGGIPAKDGEEDGSEHHETDVADVQPTPNQVDVM